MLSFVCSGFAIFCQNMLGALHLTLVNTNTIKQQIQRPIIDSSNLAGTRIFWKNRLRNVLFFTFLFLTSSSYLDGLFFVYHLGY